MSTLWGEMGKKFLYIPLELFRKFLNILLILDIMPKIYLISTPIEISTKNNYSTDLTIKINMNIKTGTSISPYFYLFKINILNLELL